MSVTASLVWLIGMAVATVAILTISTLAAADLLPRRRARDRSATRITHRGTTRRAPLTEGK